MQGRKTYIPCLVNVTVVETHGNIVPSGGTNILRQVEGSEVIGGDCHLDDGNDREIEHGVVVLVLITVSVERWVGEEITPR